MYSYDGLNKLLAEKGIKKSTLTENQQKYWQKCQNYS